MSPTTPACGAFDAVVLELDAPLAHLRVERGEPGLGGAQRVLRLLELLPADRAGLDERLEALDLLRAST